jgi:putative hydrolase of the HAD superfamily
LQPYILFDAGGTIVFPDVNLMHEVILRHGLDVSSERLKRIATEYIVHYDEVLRDHGDVSDFSDFFRRLVEGAGVAQASVDPLLEELRRIDAERSLWTFAFPWVRRALDRLRAAGYRMSVISNADGRVRQEFADLGLVRYFDEIFDSFVVGYSKPDARLFQHALTTLGLTPAQCVYVGDVYYIDVLGANRSGIAAIHLDPYDLYAGWKGCHIHNIGELPDLLVTPGLDLAGEQFFPLREAAAAS